MKLNVFEVSMLKPQLLPTVFSPKPNPCLWNWPRRTSLGLEHNALGAPGKLQGVRCVKSVIWYTSGFDGMSCSPLCPHVTEKFASHEGVSDVFKRTTALRVPYFSWSLMVVLLVLRKLFGAELVLVGSPKIEASIWLLALSLNVNLPA